MKPHNPKIDLKEYENLQIGENPFRLPFILDSPFMIGSTIPTNISDQAQELLEELSCSQCQIEIGSYPLPRSGSHPAESCSHLFCRWCIEALCEESVDFCPVCNQPWDPSSQERQQFPIFGTVGKFLKSLASAQPSKSPAKQNRSDSFEASSQKLSD